jgi:hypothetical protein
MKTDFDERLLKVASARGNAQIAAERQIEARTRCRSNDRCDHRLGHLPDRQDHASRRPERRANSSLSFCSISSAMKFTSPPAQKARPAPGKNHHANLRIAAGFFQRLCEVAAHVADESIQPIRPVERDRHDAVIFGNFD